MLLVKSQQIQELERKLKLVNEELKKEKQSLWEASFVLAV